MLDVGVTLSLDAIVIAIVLILVGIGIGYFLKDVKGIPAKLDNLSQKMDDVPDKFWDKFIDAYRLVKEVPHNPDRKTVLLNKLKSKTISKDEALELKDIMSEEAKQAQATGNFILAMVILGVIVAIGIALASLSQEE